MLSILLSILLQFVPHAATGTIVTPIPPPPPSDTGGPAGKNATGTVAPADTLGPAG